MNPKSRDDLHVTLNLRHFRTGYESFVLRFSARLVENDRVDTSRKFVLSYFLSDDTILVNQIADVNSGEQDCCTYTYKSIQRMPCRSTLGSFSAALPNQEAEGVPG